MVLGAGQAPLEDSSFYLYYPYFGRDELSLRGVVFFSLGLEKKPEILTLLRDVIQVQPETSRKMPTCLEQVPGHLLDSWRCS